MNDAVFFCAMNPELSAQWWPYHGQSLG